VPNKPRTVLIIDDEPAHRYIYRRFLEQNGSDQLTVVEAAGGVEGLEMCRTLSPDCVILDYGLPDLDGLAVLERLREFSDVPVIFITARPNPLTRARASLRGIVKYFAKDLVSSHVLNTAVAEAFDAGAKAD
jgi:CheY-like chemotaxis protein